MRVFNNLGSIDDNGSKDMAKAMSNAVRYEINSEQHTANLFAHRFN